MNHINLWTTRTVQVIAFGCFIFLAVSHVLSANPFPFADEWHILAYVTGNKEMSWEWLWALHGDHRIPLQKFVQVRLLQFSNVDFRILAFTNAVFAYLATVLLLSAIRSFRGNLHFGDLVIPLLVLNPGFGTFYWGFHFQFASSVFLAMAGMSWFIFYAKTSKLLYWILFVLSLLALALCGLNGTIAAGSISGLMLLYSLATIGHKQKIKAAFFVSTLLLPLGLVVYILSQFKLSGVSGLADGFLLFVLFDAIWHWLILMNPRSAALPAGPIVIYYLANFILYTTAIILTAKTLWNTAHSTYENDSVYIVPAAAFLGFMFLLMSIALGRSAYWSSGLEFHYGYISVMLPIASWILISLIANGHVKLVMAIGLLLIYGSMYDNNVKYTQSQFALRKPGYAEIYHSAASGMDINSFVDKYILRFFHIDTDVSRRNIANQLHQLKDAEIFPYMQLQATETSSSDSMDQPPVPTGSHR